MKCPYVIKVCTECKRILIANEMNFNKQKTGKYGLNPKCKQCRKQYRDEHKEEIKEHKKQYYEEHKEEILECCKKYYEDNKEDIKLRTNQYYHNNIEKCKEGRKRYRKENKEKIKEYREKNKEVIKYRHKKWVNNNPEYYVNYNNERRLKLENQGNGITKEQWYEMMCFFDWKCAYSGEYIGNNSDKRTIDHIIPISKGGENEIWNLVPMYANYNSSKNAKDMLSWYKEQIFYSVERLANILSWITYSMIKWKYTRL